MNSEAQNRIDYRMLDLDTGHSIRHYTEYEFHHLNYLKLYCSYLYALQREKTDIRAGDFRGFSQFLEFMVSAQRTTREIVDLIAPMLEGCSWAPKEIEAAEYPAELRYQLLFSSVRNGLFSGEFTTPSCLCSLAIRLLDIQDEEAVADYGCGEGSFLVQASIEGAEKAEFFGVDANPEAAAVAMIRASLSHSRTRIKLGSMFDDGCTHARFDKIFSNYPLGVRPAHLQGDSDYLARVKQGLPEYGRPTSADWVFNRLLFDALREGGKAVGIMTNGSAFNGLDKKIRRYFVDNGMIEGVVSLPANLLSHTSIPLCMVVLSHGNDGIRFVDAAKEFEKGRRQNTLSDKNISAIIDGYRCDSDISKFVSNDDIASKDYTLLPAHFVQEDIVVKNGAPLESLMRSVTRGSSINAKELDSMTVKRETDCQYLMLRDVIDGRISSELPYLRDIDAKLEKYCIETGDLLLSKNGAPYKVAIADVPEGKRILANGNLYVIKLDSEKVDPYYVAAFLQSDTGKRLLERSSVGAVIPNLPLSKLKKIPIPLIPLEDQRRIVARFEAKLDQIEVLKMQLEQARQDALLIFDEER